MDYQGLLDAAEALQRSALFGLRGWGEVARSLGQDGSPEAAEILSRQFARASTAQRSILTEAMGLLPDGPPLVRAWTVWEESRDRHLAEALHSRPPRLPCPVRVYVLAALKTRQTEGLTSRPMRDLVRETLVATTDKDGDIASAAVQAVDRMTHQPLVAEELALASLEDRAPRAVLQALEGIAAAAAINAVCQVWARSRNVRLGRLLARMGWRPSEPPALSLLVELKFYPDGMQAIQQQAGLLLRACSDVEADVRSQAEARFLAGRGSEWQEAVCNTVLEEDCPPAVMRALAGRRWCPREPESRAVYFLLTDQFDKAEDLDFDQQILSDAYRRGAPGLRRRIAAAIRRSRRPALSRVLIRKQGDDYRHLLLPDPEWELVIGALDAPDRVEELWSLALDAPPRWSVEALRILVRHGYQPAEADRGLFNRLAAQDLEGLRLTGWQFIEAQRQPVIESVWQPTKAGRPVALHHQVAHGAGARLVLDPGPPLPVDVSLGPLTWLAWSGDGGRLAIGRTSYVEVWDVRDAHLLARLRPTSCEAMAFSADGTRLVTQNRSAYRQYWDVDTGRHLLMDEGKAFDRVALSGDGRRMAIVRSDEWRLYEVDMDRAVDAFRLMQRETMQSGARGAALSPDGRYLAIISFDRLRVHDLVSGAIRYTVKAQTFNPCWSSDSRHVAFEQVWTSTDRRVIIVDTVVNDVMLMLHVPVACRNLETGYGPQPWTSALWITPDNQSLMAITPAGTRLSWHLSPTPLAALHLLTWKPEQTTLAGTFLSAILEFRRRYDIEIEEITFVPDEFDIELETDSQGLVLRQHG